MTAEVQIVAETQNERTSILYEVVGLAEKLRIGAGEARIRLDASRAHHSEAIEQAVYTLLTKGEGLKISIRQEPVEGDRGAVTGVDIICRRKAD